MKYSRKLMVVPYTTNYETPLKQYLTDLDKEMNEILQLNIPGDEKLKLYNSLLVKYREYYDVHELTDQTQVKHITNLLEKVQEEIKQENKELDNSIKEQYQNINLKLEKFDNDFKEEQNDDDDIKFKKTLKNKKRKINDTPRKILKGTKKSSKITKSKNNIGVPELDQFNFTMDESELNTTNQLNVGLNEGKPLTTRSAFNEYNNAKQKAKENNKNFLNINNSFGKLNINENQIANGLKKIQWTTKKYF